MGKIEWLAAKAVPLEIASIVIDDDLRGLGETVADEVKERLGALTAAHDDKSHAKTMRAEDSKDARCQSRVGQDVLCAWHLISLSVMDSPGAPIRLVHR